MEKDSENMECIERKIDNVNLEYKRKKHCGSEN